MSGAQVLPSLPASSALPYKVVSGLLVGEVEDLSKWERMWKVVGEALAQVGQGAPSGEEELGRDTYVCQVYETG